MIDTVLLDLDDTILDFHKSEAFALKKTLEELGIEPLSSIIERYSEINDAQWKLLELGKITREQVLTGRFEILFKELGVNQSGDKAWQLYENNLSNSYFIIDGTIDVLRKLKNKYRLFIAGADISKYFEDIFISQRIGYNKPKVEFFNGCFEKMNNPNIEGMIIIGDSLSSDILGGINAGIHTCWYNPKRSENMTEIKPEYEIDSLDKIFKVLEEI